jgi:PIN domain nuclease of toxin-antitoxin system
MAARSSPGAATHVLDASAILALLLGEPGGEHVEEAGPTALVSTVNLSEVVAKMLDRGASLAVVLRRLGRIPFTVVAFDRDMAEKAGALRDRTREGNISFADRACLALAVENGLPVLTGDRDWTKLKLGIDIRLIR